MFKLKPQPTFDEVASQAAKDTRAQIRAAANEALHRAGRLAINGNAEEAAKAQEIYRDLKFLAISIPLDMVEAGL